MNVLKVITKAFWGSVVDPTSLSRLNNVLGRKNVNQKCLIFQQNHDFFRTVIDALAIALCMEDLSLSNISGLKDWLAHNDWRRLIERAVEHVGPFATNDMRENAASKTEKDVETALAAKKAEWAAAHPQANRDQDQEEGRARGRGRPRGHGREARAGADLNDHEPNWLEVGRTLEKEYTKQNRDLVRENTILLLACGLLYLDFDNACQQGYSGRVEKCIECFAVMFQATRHHNYSAELLRMVACFKKLWGTDLKQAWHDYCLINPSRRPGKYCADDRFGRPS